MHIYHHNSEKIRISQLTRAGFEPTASVAVKILRRFGLFLRKIHQECAKTGFL